MKRRITKERITEDTTMMEADMADRTMTEKQFRENLAKVIDEGNREKMQELLDKYPGYWDNYERELEALRIEAETSEEFRGVNLEDFYERLKKRMQEGI